MNPRNFFAEVKRRSVYKVAVAYAVVGWLLIQIATQTFPFFEIPDWATRLVILLLVLGFPVALVLAWAFELTPEGVKRTTAPEIDAGPRHRGRLWLVIVIAAGALSTGLFLLGRYSASPAPTTSSPNAHSIAVLPFENRSEDQANAYFADGIQDEILTRLAKIEELKVISRTSTQRYKSSPENIPEIARQLGVDHILEGSVQKSGEQVRVNVQLIRAETDGHVWAEVYDRKLTDIFTVQSDIAGKIASALQLKLSGREQEAVASRPTANPEAYDAYLRGLVIWNKVTVLPEEFDEMVRYFARATELDPTFALAWAYLSVAHAFKYGGFDSTAERAAAAQKALERAQQLQPDLGEAHFAEGMYRYKVLRDFERALESFQKARERLANRAIAIEFSSYVKRRQGKWEEALRLHEESLELDPLNPIILSEAALTYRALLRFAEAHALMDRALAIEPENTQLLAQKAEIHLAQGDTAAAGRLLNSVSVEGRDPTVTMAYVRYWIMLRQYNDAIRALERVLAAPERLPEMVATNYRAELAIAQALAGNPDAPVALRRAQEELSAIRTRGGDTNWTAMMLLLVSGLLKDETTVDAVALQLADKIKADAVSGPSLQNAIAIARAHLGETEVALESARRLLQTPTEGALTPALLRLDPLWDPLRGDPRFRALCEKKQP